MSNETIIQNLTNQLETLKSSIGRFSSLNEKLLTAVNILTHIPPGENPKGSVNVIDMNSDLTQINIDLDNNLDILATSINRLI